MGKELHAFEIPHLGNMELNCNFTLDEMFSVWDHDFGFLGGDGADGTAL